jgi:cytidylate kinase
MKLNNQIIIAVDGHSSCGKSTFAKQIAQKLNYIYIDSGAMYRAVAYYAIKNNLVQEKHILVEELIKQLPDIHIRFQRNPDGDLETLLNNENIEEHIRGVAVSELVSEVSKIKEVRAYLVKLQQEMGQHKGIVMDGRDIGTVVFPEAEIKLFMTAQPEVRAKRRYDELIAKGD